MSDGKWMNDIHTGDAFDVLPELADESVHACVPCFYGVIV